MAAGAIAKKILAQVAGVEILAFVSAVRDVRADDVDLDTFTLEQCEANIVRCPDAAVAERMIAAIDEVRVKGDSCGGVVTCVCRNVPRGLGAPVFDKLEADLAHAMLSLPATKGFEVGSGFGGTLMKGTEHNDEFYLAEGGLLRTRTNRSGGIQGGISNGENVVLRVAFKPTSTVTQAQRTVTRAGEETELRARGRHDPCVVPRAVPMVEAMAALVLVDHLLQQQAQCMIMGRTVPPELLYGNMPTLYDANVRPCRPRIAFAVYRADAHCARRLRALRPRRLCGFVRPTPRSRQPPTLRTEGCAGRHVMRGGARFARYSLHLARFALLWPRRRGPCVPCGRAAAPWASRSASASAAALAHAQRLHNLRRHPVVCDCNPHEACQENLQRKAAAQRDAACRGCEVSARPSALRLTEARGVVSRGVRTRRLRCSSA